MRPFLLKLKFYNRALLRLHSTYISNMKPKLYITRADVPEEYMKLLREKFCITSWHGETPIPRDELLKHVRGIDALFCYLTDRIDKQVLDNAGSDLKVIGTMSVGYDHIDIEELKKRGIKLGITPDVLTDAVAELAVGLLLATSRRLFESHREIINGKWTSWAPFWMCGHGLQDSTVGIVGFGRIGQEIAKRLKPFKVSTFLYTGHSDKPEATEIGAVRVSLDDLLKNSDFVIVSCSLTPETEKLFNENTFSKMKSSSIFVNISRGGVVDQPALQKALETKQILAAGLDVMTPEPLPADHPLLKLKNCVIIPHIGSATYQSRNAMVELTVRNLIAGIEGELMPGEAF